ncbi:MAG: putative manganese-dependent inorganic diphosphatase [Defluviitaleaceae bacterium]|nr:putative manganese-dependent inorganic diphosphatase [Defluviitaleaceae bacterium]
MSNKDNVYIFGHKKPDTDTICSAMAYAHLKREMGLSGAVAYRLGEINQETAYVLEHFEQAVPQELKDVKLQISDLDIYKPVTLLESQPIKLAWDIMQQEETSRLVPVVDAGGKLKGIIGIGDITEIFMEDGEDISLSKYEILYENFISTLSGSKVGGGYGYEKLSGRLFIGDVCEGVEVSDKDIIITSNADEAWRLAYQYDFGCIILADGKKPKNFENFKCALVCVEASALKVANLIKQAISIGSIMKPKDIIAFYEDTYLDAVFETMRNTRFRNFPILHRDGSLYGILSRRHVMGVPGKKVILVDHNEKGQSADGLDQAEIIEIIDHHRIADLQTNAAPYSRIEPVGCTSTIIYKLYKENGVDIPKGIAGLMLSAILSDTLKFSSPTCTPQDEEVGRELARIAGVDIDAYASEMFKAGTNMDAMSVREMLEVDQKPFTFGKASAYVSQIMVMDLPSMLARKDEILAEMEAFRAEVECDLITFMVTDLTQNGSELFAVGGAKDLVEMAFGMKPAENSIFLPDVVSRKKQIVPILTQMANTPS